MRNGASAVMRMGVASIIIALALSSVLLQSPSARADDFTTDPKTTIEPLSRYNYTVGWNGTPGLNMSTTADWLVLFNGSGNEAYLLGVPLKTDIGIYTVSIWVTNGTNKTYQNFTLEVGYETPPGLDSGAVLVLVFGFALTAIGAVDRKFLIFAGLVWIAGALLVFVAYGEIWVIISLGLGFILLAEGGLSVMDNERG